MKNPPENDNQITEKLHKELLLKIRLHSITNSASTVSKYSITSSDDELVDLTKVLAGQVNEMLKTDRLESSQRMLAAQAYALEAIFHNLANRAAINFGEYTRTGELYMKLALRAQSQCRSTLEALNEIKNPRLANVVGQANIASGHQQVNNHSGPRAEEIKNQPNELLEAEEHEQLDIGAKKATSREHSKVEAVGEIDGAEK